MSRAELEAAAREWLSAYERGPSEPTMNMPLGSAGISPHAGVLLLVAANIFRGVVDAGERREMRGATRHAKWRRLGLSGDGWRIAEDLP